jgi:L,D-transpeptidase ErfK/SrfK
MLRLTLRVRGGRSVGAADSRVALAPCSPLTAPLTVAAPLLGPGQPLLRPLFALVLAPLVWPGGGAAALPLPGPGGPAAPRGSLVSPPAVPPPSPNAAAPVSGAALLQGDEPLAIGAGSAPASAPAPVLLSPGALGAPSASASPPPPLLPAPPAASAAPAAVAPVPSRALVLDRRRRMLTVLENGLPLRRFPVAVGMPGWETPVGRFTVMQKTENPVWEHPEKGTHTPAGPNNPLGSRWIGFHRDCNGRRGWDGDQFLDVKGCVLAGFHGTPHRWTVGQAVSHGCVRLYDEDVRSLYDLVSLGTPVTVLP